MTVGHARRVLLSGQQWRLLRAPLRPEGDRTSPDLAGADDFGDVAVPGNIQVQLGFENLWLDVPELTTINHHEWLYPPGRVARVRSRGSRVPRVRGRGLLLRRVPRRPALRPPRGHVHALRARCDRPAGARRLSDELVVAVSCPWRVDGRQVFLQPSTVFSPNQKNSEYMKGNLLHYWDGLPFSGNAVFPFGPWKDVHLAVRPACSLRSATVSTIAIDRLLCAPRGEPRVVERQ